MPRRLALVAAAAATLSPGAAVAGPAVVGTSPGTGAVTTGRSVELVLRLAPGTRVGSVELNGTRVRGRIAGGRWRARVGAAAGLHRGPNVLRFSVRSGRTPTRGVVRFDHAVRDARLLALRVARVRGGPWRAVASVPAGGVRIRFWLNGRRIEARRLHADPRAARVSVTPSHGLRPGANVLRVEALAADGSRVDVETRRTVIPAGQALVGAGLDRTVRLHRAVRLRATAPGAAARGSRAATAPTTYQWQIVEQPAGSQATLTGATSAAPTLVPDGPGAYRIGVIATAPTGDVASAQQVTTVLPEEPFVPFASAAAEGGVTGVVIGGVAYGPPSPAGGVGDGRLIVLSLDRDTLGSPILHVSEPLGETTDAREAIQAAVEAIEGNRLNRLMVVSYQPYQATPGAPYAVSHARPLAHEPFAHALAGIGADLGADEVPEGGVGQGAPFTVVGVAGLDVGQAWRSPTGSADGALDGYLALSPVSGSGYLPPTFGLVPRGVLGATAEPTTDGSPPTVSAQLDPFTTAATPVAGPASADGLLVGIVDSATGALDVQFHATGALVRNDALAAQRALAARLHAAGPDAIVLIASAGTWLRSTGIDPAAFGVLLSTVESAGGTSNVLGFSALPALYGPLTPVQKLSVGLAPLGVDAPLPYGFVGRLGLGHGVESSPLLPVPAGAARLDGSVSATFTRDRTGRFGRSSGSPTSSFDRSPLVEVSMLPPVSWTNPDPAVQAAIETRAAQLLASARIPVPAGATASDALRATYLDDTQLAKLLVLASVCDPASSAPADVAACTLTGELTALSSLDAYLQHLEDVLSNSQFGADGSATDVAGAIEKALEPPVDHPSLFDTIFSVENIAAVGSAVAGATGNPEVGAALRGVSAVAHIAESVDHESDGSALAPEQVAASKVAAGIHAGFLRQIQALDVAHDAIASDRGRLAAFADHGGDDFAWRDELADRVTAQARLGVQRTVYTGLLPATVGLHEFAPMTFRNQGTLLGTTCLAMASPRGGTRPANIWWRLVGVTLRPGGAPPLPTWSLRAIVTRRNKDVVDTVFARDGNGLGLTPPRFYFDAYGNAPSQWPYEYGAWPDAGGPYCSAVYAPPVD